MGELLLYKKRLSHSHKTDTKKGKRNFLSRMRICPQSIAELFEVTVGELLGAKIEEKADAVGLNEIAAQLTILKEQLANQSPHRRKFIKITAFGVFCYSCFYNCSVSCGVYRILVQLFGRRDYDDRSILHICGMVSECETMEEAVISFFDYRRRYN